MHTAAVPGDAPLLNELGLILLYTQLGIGIALFIGIVISCGLLFWCQNERRKLQVLLKGGGSPPKDDQPNSSGAVSEPVYEAAKPAGPSEVKTLPALPQVPQQVPEQTTIKSLFQPYKAPVNFNAAWDDDEVKPMTAEEERRDTLGSQHFYEPPGNPFRRAIWSPPGDYSFRPVQQFPTSSGGHLAPQQPSFQTMTLGRKPPTSTWDVNQAISFQQLQLQQQQQQQQQLQQQNAQLQEALERCQLRASTNKGKKKKGAEKGARGGGDIQQQAPVIYGVAAPAQPQQPPQPAQYVLMQQQQQ